MEFEKIYQGNLVEIFRVSDYFYFRKADLPVRGQCNSAFIVGETGVAIVDATPDGIEMADESEKLFHKPVTSILLTHGHGDHIDGLKDWLDRNITVYCSRRLIECLDPSFLKRRTSFVGIEGPVQLYLAGNVEIDLVPNSDVAHSKWDTFIKVPGVGVVCTGDSVVEYQTAYFHSADIRSWILSLRRLAEQKGTWVLAGHGDSLFPYSYINEFADYLVVIERCAQICLQRRWANPSETADPRFVNLTAVDVRDEVEKLFSEKGKDTRMLEERAGPEDARREVRMALWSMLRMYIR